MSIRSRINWAFYRRHSLQNGIKGFRAHLTSMVDEVSSVGTYCQVGPRSSLLNGTMGDYSYISSDSIVKNVDIGKFCSIGPNTRIGGLGVHPTNWISTHPIFYSTRKQVERSFVESSDFDEDMRTTIGNDVWIGAHSVILDGARIHNGAIIAAGAVVKGEVEPYSIVGGVPAKIIRYRFEPEVRTALLDLAWWDRDDDILKDVASLFTQKTEWTKADVLFLREKLGG